MKFIYIDESGSRDRNQGDIFVMAGLLIDAFRLRKQTVNFNRLIQGFLHEYPRPKKEIKTKAMINGSGDWSKVDAHKRKVFLEAAVDLTIGCAEIYAIAFSLEKFHITAQEMREAPPFGTNHWVGAAMFLAAMIQKKMQTLGRNKGHTVVVFDDNKKDLPKVSDCLYQADPWFDALYQRRVKKRVSGKDKMMWLAVKPNARFEQIISSAFPIKSEHSPFVQTADMISYIYKRHLELVDEEEKWPGERNYYNGLVQKLDAKFKKLGLVAPGPCVDFYRRVKHRHWEF